ncbi:MAG: hypothetical protein Q4D56_06575 [Bacteroides sp.]|nr:hypothetical protein [Bacteroides sp.]
MLSKQIFQKQFPDVTVQQIETIQVYDRQKAEKLALSTADLTETGLLGYERVGKKIKIYTSEKMKVQLSKMTTGYQVFDPNTGRRGTITCDTPLLLGGEMCVNVDFDGQDSGWYSATYFM